MGFGILVKQILRRANKVNSTSLHVPKGFLAVHVGETQKKRFLVPVSCLNQPSFLDLLSIAEEEFGFEHAMGGSMIPCDEETYFNRRMGRKVSNLTINPKKFGAFGKPCMQEMVKLLNCMALNSNSDEKCIKFKDILTACMDAQAGKKRKPWGSVNYQFRKLDKQSK